MTAVEQASGAQVDAAHPERSTWVSANAGSGKTRVLTNRVARLLLAGCAPQKILCLTYTKAAAAEMQNRLFERLGEWAMKPDADLRAELDMLGEGDLDAEKLRLARTLFARALETPGGLKIQTIHSFCGNILRRFPLEAGVSPQFQEVDERQAKQMQTEIIEEIATDSGETFDAMAWYLSGDAPDNLLSGILKTRGSFSGTFDARALAETLDTEVGLSDEAILAGVMQGYCDAQIERLAKAMAAGAKTDIGHASNLDAAAGMTAARALDLYQKVFLVGSGEPRKGNFPTKSVKAASPWVVDILETLKARMVIAREQRLAQQTLKRAEVLHDFGHEFLRRYEAQKAALGRLDFDDLIEGTRALLTRSNMAAWVLYRLDGGIEHILVDEAQDTSPAQWDIVRILAEEFHTGAEDRQTPRTVFVVGDEKQSIYSFQGADPSAFGAMRRMFATRLLQVGQSLQETDLLYSFRTAAPILQLVDQVFTGDAREGLTGEITHRAVWDMPGRVELWPFIEKPGTPEPKPWHLPVDSAPPDDPDLQLAQAIATRIAEMIRTGQVLPLRDGGRPVSAGDFLILVQSRTPLFHAIIKALKSEGVDVAGADRLKIANEMAVKDLLALLQFLTTPEDDLSLAATLRSPLFGFSETDLYRIAQGRKGTLWQSLHRSRDIWPEVVGELDSLLGKADFQRPYDLLEQILVVHDGRRKLLARLGTEAEDGIDELLNQSLQYESVEAPTLGGFLDWITSGDVEVKRQMDAAGGRVRVMTVHGAKGLEAPIVILPDSRKKDASKNAPAILETAGHAFWKPNAENMPEALKTLENKRRQLVDEEARRLLYVALTRAESWLIVCGAGAPDTTGEGWYERVARAMEACGATAKPAPAGLNGKMQVLSQNWQDTQGDVVVRQHETVPLPAFLRQPLPAPIRAQQMRAPSDLQGAHTVSGTDIDTGAMLRGSRIHQLLEVLPTLPRHAWAAKAAQLAPDMDVLGEVQAVLEASGLRDFFGPDALMEVPVSATIDALGGQRILGRIDRLLVRDTEVIALDFKSNREVPDCPENTPEGILRQMGAYSAALAKIYPGRAIKTAIIWTTRAELMELPQNVTHAAILRAGAS